MTVRVSTFPFYFRGVKQLNGETYLSDRLSKVFGAPVAQAGLQGQTDVVPVADRLVAVFSCLNKNRANKRVGFKESRSHAFRNVFLKRRRSSFPHLLRTLVKHFPSAWKLVRVRRLSSQCGCVGGPRGGLLSVGGFGDVVGQAGAAGAGHGWRATEAPRGTKKNEEDEKQDFSCSSHLLKY